MWFGWSVSVWETIFFWVTAAAAGLGALGLAAAFTSAVIGYKISDEVTRESNLQIAEANERTAALENRAEELRRQNLELQANLVSLQRNVARRRVTPEQTAKIVAALAHKHVSTTTVSVVQDFEAMWYGAEISSALAQAGVNAPLHFLKGAPPIHSGVTVCPANKQDHETLAFLMDVGIGGVLIGPDALGKRPSYCPPGTIFVGIKPPLP
jgi:hypothetical protein